MDALHLRTPFIRYGQPVANHDALDHEHPVSVEDLAGRIHLVPVPLDFDLTRFQRACEGARQSAAGRGYDVVERGGMWRVVVG